MAKLTCNDFELDINFVKTGKISNDGEDVFDVQISVKDIHYSGDIYLYYFTKGEIKVTVERISELYETLKEGLVGFYDNYDYEPENNNIKFVSDGLGHFIVKGVFNAYGDWMLKFSKLIDQTYFKSFLKQLTQAIE
jgi:hypothetical protein